MQLAQQGVEISEDESLADMELLGEVMEIREALEDADTQEQVDALRQSNQDEIQRAVSSMQSLFEQQDWDAAKQGTIRLRYLMNVDTACKDWQAGKPIVLQH